MRIWLDPRTGLVLREMIVDPARGGKTLLFEVPQVSFDPPPASLFAVPSQCDTFPVVPRTEAAPESGTAPSGSPGEYAWDALVGPASKEPRTMLFRVVGSGSLKPLTHGIQVGADLAVATEPSPHYSVRLDDRGARHLFRWTIAPACAGGIERTVPHRQCSR